jgi:hypothetical protein
VRKRRGGENAPDQRDCEETREPGHAVSGEA